MNKIRKIAIAFILIEIVLLVFANIEGRKYFTNTESHAYKVDISRVADRMRAGEELDAIDLQAYPAILSVSEFDTAAIQNEEYTVEDINGTLYRFAYKNADFTPSLIFINVIFVAMILLTAVIFIYLDRRILRPFGQMNDYATQLAKGNLVQPMKQDRGRYFKKFVWGMDMLREKLEDDKTRELELLKEKQTMVLSLSHDIKTPLSAMELYTKALSEDLYKSEEEREAALAGIEKNIQEISRYVSQIAETSRDDLLRLDVENKEIYLKDVVSDVQAYYKDKCQKLHIAFEVTSFENCLIYGDHDRLIEVLQNAMENAIKYGDGRRITISFSEEEDCKLITVENSGCTLKEEELTNIFDSFYRGSNSENKKGSGLGLYICKALMHQMDGEIFAAIKDGNFQITVVTRKL